VRFRAPRLPSLPRCCSRRCSVLSCCWVRLISRECAGTQLCQAVCLSGLLASCSWRVARRSASADSSAAPRLSGIARLHLVGVRLVARLVGARAGSRARVVPDRPALVCILVRAEASGARGHGQLCCATCSLRLCPAADSRSCSQQILRILYAADPVGSAMHCFVS
jgi:hypothetical protein